MQNADKMPFALLEKTRQDGFGFLPMVVDWCRVKERISVFVAEGGLCDDRAVFIACQVFYVEAVWYQAVMLATGAIWPPSFCYDKPNHSDHHGRREVCAEGEDILVARHLSGVGEAANIGRVIQRTVDVEDDIGTGVLTVAPQTTKHRTDGRDAPCRLSECTVQLVVDEDATGNDGNAMCIGDVIKKILGKRSINCGEQDIAIESGGEGVMVLNWGGTGPNFEIRGGCRFAGVMGDEIDLLRTDVVFRGVEQAV